MSPNRFQVIPLLTGGILVVLGTGVCIGWGWQLPSLVQVLPRLPAMSFPTAISFVLAGLSLITSTLSVRFQIIPTLCAASIGIIATLNLGLLASNAMPDIWGTIHRWFNESQSKQVRMALPTTIAFILASSALFRLKKTETLHMQYVRALLGMLVFLIGAIATLGYSLSIEAFYSWYIFSYMALHTAIGMMMLGAGVFCLNRHIFSKVAFSDGGIIATSLSVLVGTSFSIALVFWSTINSSMMTMLSEGLQLAQVARSEQIETIIQLRSIRAALVSNNHEIIENLEQVNTSSKAPIAKQNIFNTLSSYMNFGFSSIRIYDHSDNKISDIGTAITNPELTIELTEQNLAVNQRAERKSKNTTELIWSNGFLLRRKVNFRNENVDLGYVVTEQPLTEVDSIINESIDDITDAELLICASVKNIFHCFPTRKSKKPFVLPKDSADNIKIANDAINGNRNAITIQDFNDKNVVAAYGPIDKLGLITILKSDSSVLYQPVLKHLQVSASILLTLTLIGIFLIYIRVRPIVRKIRSNEMKLKSALDEAISARLIANDANHAKSLFLSSMSHELRTPLNGVLGYVQMLSNNPSTLPDQQRQLDAIQSCGEHLLTLINDVLDLSKIESGSLELNISDCNLYNLLEGISDIVRQRALSKKLSFLLEIDPNLPQFIKTDEVKLRQILVNLLGNAVKFTDHGQIIFKASSQKNGNELLIQVFDTGIGIPTNRQEEIFLPFKQIGRSAGGTGLGLSISRRLCEAMNGSLHVESEIEKGSTFSVTLPLIIGEPVKTLQLANTTYPVIDVGDRDISILIADDNVINCQVLSGMLRASGFSTDEAENGEDAITALQQKNYALVLIDVRMPVMDGLTATQLIKQDPALRTTKVIAVSASVSPETIEQMRNAGCDDFIKKPVRIREVFVKISQHLGLPMQEIEIKRRSEMA